MRNLPALARLLVPAAAFALAACAAVPDEPVWIKQGASKQDRKAAIDECVALAEAGRPEQERRDRQQIDKLGNVFLKCMKERGWTQKRAH
jgi:hypothetical protein